MTETKPAEVRPGQVRLSVNLANDVAVALRGYAETHKCSITEAVRRSIALLKFADDEIKSGNKLYVVDGHVDHKDRSTMRELVFLQ
jgi:hypothetical protein